MWQALTDGAAALGLTISPAAEQALQLYVKQLLKWNKVMNLTAITDKDKIITHHLLDSLALIPHIKGQRIADIGSGAGFPGIPLAILRPEWQIHLIESNHKKVHFLLQIKQLLQLHNVEVIGKPCESYQPEQCFDTITARAVATLAKTVALGAHLCCPDGQFVLMKGQYPEAELAELGPHTVVNEVIPIKVPGLEAARHLVYIQLDHNEGKSD